MSKQTRTVQIRSCDICGNAIEVIDPCVFKKDYITINLCEEGPRKYFDICEDCVAKIVVEKFQIGKGGIVKDASKT